jgi:MFS family permease
MKVTERDPTSTIITATLLATSALVPLGGATLAPALPAISENFQDVANAGLWARLVLTLPALFIAASAPFAGYIVDKLGRKNVLIVSMLTAGVAGLSGIFAPTLAFLLISRALVGIGVAGIMTSATTLIADYYYGPDRSRIMGLQSGFMGIGGTILLLLIGILTDIDWRAAFLVYVLPLLILPLDLLVIYEPRHEDRCEEKPTPAGDPGVCVAESIEARTSAVASPDASGPIPVKLIAFIYGVIFLIQIAFYIVPVQLPFYLQDLTGATAAQSGLAISTMTLSFALSSIFLFRRAAARLDHINVLLVALTLFGAGYALVSLVGDTPALYLALVMSGVGMGLTVPNLYVWLADEAPLAIRARALGGFTTALFLGQFLSPLISQPVTVAFDAQATFLIAGVVLLLLVPCFFATRRQLRQATSGGSAMPL